MHKLMLYVGLKLELVPVIFTSRTPDKTKKIMISICFLEFLNFPNNTAINKYIEDKSRCEKAGEKYIRHNQC